MHIQTVFSSNTAPVTFIYLCMYLCDVLQLFQLRYCNNVFCQTGANVFCPRSQKEVLV